MSTDSPQHQDASDANGVPDECDIDFGTSQDCDGNGVPDECPGGVGITPPLAETDPVQKNRYLSFTGTNPGCSTGIRVQLLFSPYTIMWVGPPQDICGNSGLVAPPCSNPKTKFMAATLQCTPYYTDWSAVGLVHVSADEVKPTAWYDLRAVHEQTGTLSTPRFVSTPKWGDLVGVFSNGEWTPPDGVVDIINDITAILAKFSNGPTAPIKARCDLAPQVPDRIVDFPNDVQQVINAFQGQSYPFGFNGCP